MKLRWSLRFILSGGVVSLAALTILHKQENRAHTVVEHTEEERTHQAALRAQATNEISAEAVSSNTSGSAQGRNTQSSPPGSMGGVPEAERKISTVVQIKPIVSNQVQNQMQSPWSKDKKVGLRKVHDPESAALGPIALRSFHGKTFVVDEADGRVVQTDASGRILESIPLPMRNPQQVHMTDDGQFLVWDPTQPTIVQKSSGTAEQNEKRRWESVELPKVPDPVTRDAIAIYPTRLFQLAGTTYAENQYGQLHPVGKSVSPAAPLLPGRPTANSDLFIRIARGHPKSGSVFVQAWNAGGDLQWERKLEHEGEDPHIIALETSNQFDFVVAAWEISRNQNGLEKRITLCAKLSLSGEVLSILELPQTIHDGFDVRDPILVDDRTSFLHMLVSEAGVRIDRHSWK